MKVLVTGGAGFIGHHISLCLHDKGFDVVVVDNLSRALDKNVKLILEKGIKLIVDDIVDGKLFDYINIVKPDVVVHAAALTNVYESFKNPLL